MVHLSEELMTRHAQALRALARGLLGDEHAAEDAVQETWIVALERDPEPRPDSASAETDEATRTERPDGLGSWLKGITRRLALQRRRSDGRRNAHERDASQLVAAQLSSSVPTVENGRLGDDVLIDVDPAASEIERREVARKLLDAVLALEEPYQSVIWKRFYEDLDARAIAQRTATPVATVKSRLARALRLLRERLDRDVDGGRTTWVGALAALEPWRGLAPWLPDPSVDPLTGSAPTVTASSGSEALKWTGARMLEWKWIVTASAVGLMGVTAIEWSAGDAASSAGQALANELGQAESVVVAPLAPQGAADEPRQDAAQQGRELVAAEPEIERLFGSAAAPHTFALSGQVVDATDLPLLGARVFAAPYGMPFNQVATTDIDGRFAVAWSGDSPRTELAMFVDGPRGSVGLRVFDVESGKPLTLRLALEPMHNILAVERIDRLDKSSKELLVQVQRQQTQGKVFEFEQSTFTWPAPVMLERLREHKHRIELQRRQAQLVNKERAIIERTGRINRVGPPSEAEELVELADISQGFFEELPEQRVLRVVGAVNNPSGEPVDMAYFSPIMGWTHLAKTAPDGSFELAAPLDHLLLGSDDGILALRAGGGDHGIAAKQIDLGEWKGEELSWSVHLDAGRIVAGQLLDPDGAPLCASSNDTDSKPRWVIEYVAASGHIDRTLSTDGSFEIPNLPPGSGRLVVRKADADFALFVEPNISAGDEDVRLTIPAEAFDTGRLRLAVVDAEGSPETSAELLLLQPESGLGQRILRTSEQGTFGPLELPAGAYRVLVGAFDTGYVDLGLVEVPRDDVNDLGLVQLGTTAAVSWNYDGGIDGVAWRIERHDTAAIATVGTGILETGAPEQLLPGRYSLHLEAPDFSTPAIPFEVSAGAENLVLVSLAGHQEVTLVFGTGPTAFRIEALEAGSATEVWSGSTVADGVALHLGPGSYRVSAGTAVNAATGVNTETGNQQRTSRFEVEDQALHLTLD